MPAIPQTLGSSLVPRVIIYSSSHSAFPTWAIAVIVVIGVLSFLLNIYIYIKKKEKKERLNRELAELRAAANGAPQQAEMTSFAPANGDDYYKSNYNTQIGNPSEGVPSAPAQIYTSSNGAPEVSGGPNVGQGLGATTPPKKERKWRWF